MSNISNLICNDPHSYEVPIYEGGPFTFSDSGDQGDKGSIIQHQKDLTITIPENATIAHAEFSVIYYPFSPEDDVSGFDNILCRTNYVKFIFSL